MRHRSRRILLLFGVPATIVALLASWLLLTAWGRVPSYEPEPTLAVPGPVRTAGEYEQVSATHARRYVYEVDAPDAGAVLIYGAAPTRDPNDPALARIEDAFAAFEPTIALVEGNLGVVLPAFMDPVETLGAPGLVHALARQRGIPTYSWEPPPLVLVNSLGAQGFEMEQIALRLALQPYFARRRDGRPDDPEAFVLDSLRRTMRESGLTHELRSIRGIERAWKRHFPDGPDWRDVSDEHGLPGFLGGMDMHLARDQYLARCVADLVGRGERVFVICGTSHAVRVEPAVRAVATE